MATFNEKLKEIELFLLECIEELRYERKRWQSGKGDNFNLDTNSITGNSTSEQDFLGTPPKEIHRPVIGSPAPTIAPIPVPPNFLMHGVSQADVRFVEAASSVVHPSPVHPNRRQGWFQDQEIRKCEQSQDEDCSGVDNRVVEDEDREQSQEDEQSQDCKNEDSVVFPLYDFTLRIGSDVSDESNQESMVGSLTSRIDFGGDNSHDTRLKITNSSLVEKDTSLAISGQMARNRPSVPSPHEVGSTLGANSEGKNCWVMYPSTTESIPDLRGGNGCILMVIKRHSLLSGFVNTRVFVEFCCCSLHGDLIKPHGEVTLDPLEMDMLKLVDNWKDSIDVRLGDFQLNSVIFLVKFSAPKVFVKMSKKEWNDVAESVKLLSTLGHFFYSVDSSKSFVFDPGKSNKFLLHNGSVEALVTLVFDPGGDQVAEVCAGKIPFWPSLCWKWRNAGHELAELLLIFVECGQLANFCC